MTINENDGIRIKSSIESLRGLLDEVKAGRLRLPAFQRSFTWSNEQIADLFDSILQGYPIGSLFLWNTLGDHVTSETIGPFPQPARKPGTPMSLVVDGQHRIVTLVGVLLGGPDAEDRWRLYYDPVVERFVHSQPGRPLESRWVPVASLFSMLGAIREANRVMAIDEEQGQIWVQRIERVARAITEYQVPVIGYSGDLSSAIEVFRRLNQKGKAMGPDELLSALTYRETPGESFRLADQIDSLLADVENSGFGAINRTFVLRSILAAAELDIYSRDWNALAKELQGSKKTQDLLQVAVDEARAGLMAAVRLLQANSVFSIRQLSYGMQLVALSAFLGINPSPDLVQQTTLLRMIWVSSFSSWFGLPAQERALVRELRSLARSNREFRTLDAMDLETPALPMPSHVDQRSARVRALVNVLVAQNPRRVDGTPLGAEIGPLLLVRDENPLTRIFTRGPKDLLASPANRVIAVSNEGGAARTWICKIPADLQDKVLPSLAIRPEDVPLLNSNDAEAFLISRQNHLDQLERIFMRERGVTEPKSGAKPAPSPIDSDE
jgi:hypothetical protein